jgi:hypothetical protein
MAARRPKISRADSTGFEHAARPVLDRVRDAFAAVIDALPRSSGKASEVARILDVDRKLAWKFWRVVNSPDPFAMVPHIPGAPGVEIFLNAARAHGVAPTTVNAAHTAFVALEKLIAAHAGDRGSFEMMVKAYSEDPQEHQELAHRKAAFAGNSFTWGVQARTQLAVNILAPSRSLGKVDIALVGGLIDLRRLRPKVAWVVARTGFIAADGQTHAHITPETSLEQRERAAAGYRIPLLTEFCSAPLPEFRTRLTEHGQVEIELVEGPVGERAAITCLFGADPYRGVGARFAQPGNPTAHLNAHIRTPSTMLVFDVLAPPDLFGPIDCRAAAYSEVHREVRSAATRDERYRLPIHLSMQRLGRSPGAAGLRTPHVPNYPQMIRHVCQRYGWNADDFEVHRLLMPYPIVPSAVVVSFDLPAAVP